MKTQKTVSKQNPQNLPQRENWEEELFYWHRWGQHGKEKADEEHARLKKFWNATKPINQGCKELIPQICALEICNWNLEESILELYKAIGLKKPSVRGIGHMSYFTDDRWKQIWAYYLTLRNWLPCPSKTGYKTILQFCDPDKIIQSHILTLLGERTHLKELYITRFCLCLEFWLGGSYPQNSMQRKTHDAAVAVIEYEIKKLDPDGLILNAFNRCGEGVTTEGNGRLNPCSHKLFRRYDIIISSIGAGRWRGAFPFRGTDGFEREIELEKELAPIEAWINRSRKRGKDKISLRIEHLLGKPQPIKVFLASLLVSLLRAQQLAAHNRAEKRKVASDKTNGHEKL
jgi:hypothetical protein